MSWRDDSNSAHNGTQDGSGGSRDASGNVHGTGSGSGSHDQLQQQSNGNRAVATRARMKQVAFPAIVAPPVRPIPPAVQAVPPVPPVAVPPVTVPPHVVPPMAPIFRNPFSTYVRSPYANPAVYNPTNALNYHPPAVGQPAATPTVNPDKVNRQPQRSPYGNDRFGATFGNAIAGARQDRGGPGVGGGTGATGGGGW